MAVDNVGLEVVGATSGGAVLPGASGASMDGTSGAGSEVNMAPAWPPPTLEVPLAQELAERHRTITALQARAFTLAARARRALTEAAWWSSDD